MAPFDFFGAPRIVFGRGRITQLGELAATLGSTAMLLYNGGDPRGGAVGRAVSMLAAAGLKVVPHRQRGEPTVDDVNAAVIAAREGGCDLVVGIGGGSAIDAAKAAAGLLANGGSAIDYMEVVGRGQKITKPAAPWIAVPATAGTGAEVTRNAVIGYPEKQFKASLRSEYLMPRFALVDPELGLDVPPEVTARSGLDALCQLIESYTSTGAQPMTDALAIHGIPLAARSLRRAYQDGGDVAAREDMVLAALLSGITLTNAGLGAVHGFAAPLGANFAAPHGAICGALLPHVMAANVAAARALPADDEPARRTLARYAVVGRTLAGRSDWSDADAIQGAVQFAATLARDVNIPALARFGIIHDHAPKMVSLARKSSSMRYNPLVLSDEALTSALHSAIGSAER